MQIVVQYLILEAQRRTVVARSDLLLVRRSRLDARIDLILALGGGSERVADDEESVAVTPTETQQAAP